MGHARRVAVAILIDQQGRLLLGRRPPGSRLSGVWEFPGGKVEEYEDRITALARELLEEVGITFDRAELIRSERNMYGSDIFEVDYFVLTEWHGEPRSSHYTELAWVLPGDLDQYDHLSGNNAICEALSGGEYDAIIHPHPPPHQPEP